MAFHSGEFAVAASATALSTALGITDSTKFHAKVVILRNARAAANNAFVGDSTVTTAANRGDDLAAGTQLILDSSGHWGLDLSKIFVIGTVAAGNRIHAIWID